jgi:hypothetical protein
MWGNTLGWRISGVMLAMALALGLYLRAQMQLTSPTSLSLDPKNTAVFAPPTPAEAIIDPTQPGDAANLYRQAIAAYDNTPSACEDFADTAKEPAPEPMRFILQATPLQSMNLFASEPEKLIDYEGEHPALDNLSTMGQQMSQAGERMRLDKNVDAARRYGLAVFALGRHLYQERIDFDEYQKGLGVMDAALTLLSECEPEDSSRRSVLDEYQTALGAYNTDHVTPIYTVLASADQTSIATYAGDAYRFASPLEQEPMVRVEAILKLGRYRFDSARMADQIASPRYLRRYAAERSPAIQAAAQAGLALTLEEYRKIH